MFNVKVNTYNIQFTFKHMRGIGAEVGISDVTYCQLFVNGQKFSGVAACSLKDLFNKTTGRKISLKRAIEDARKKIELSPRERQAIWERYFQRCVPNDKWQWLWNEQTLADGILDPEYRPKAGSDDLVNQA